MSDIERGRHAERRPEPAASTPMPLDYLRMDDLAGVPGMSRYDVRVDRRRQAHYVLTVRELQRQALEDAAVEAAKAYVQSAAVEARRRALTTIKLQLLRARKDSQILAGDDLELTAKFAQLDDDFFFAVRLMGMP